MNEPDIEWVQDGDHSLMGTMMFGKQSVSAIAVPRSSIEGEDGPVLIPVIDDDVLIVALAEEYIEKELVNADNRMEATFRLGVLVGHTLAFGMKSKM